MSDGTTLRVLKTATSSRGRRRAGACPRGWTGGSPARHGTASLLVVVEPLAGRRHVAVTDRRAAADSAARVKYLCDEWYPQADVIRVALDDRNAHALGSLFAAYPPEEARRLEFHHTPRHASWRDMAGCERSAPARPCPHRRIADGGEWSAEVGARVATRNAAGARIHWTFRAAGARRTLAHLYPHTRLR